MAASDNLVASIIRELGKYPNKTAAFFFSVFARLGQRLMRFSAVRGVFIRFGNFFALLLTVVAPAVPEDVTKALSYKNRWAIAKYASLTTIFFCFFMNLALAWYFGTLNGTDPSRQYFWNDWPDILQWTVIVPISVAINCCLIATVLNNWQYLHDRAEEASKKREGQRKLTAADVPFWLSSSFRFFVGMFLCLFLTGFFMTTYINDILSTKVSHTYWFANHVSAGSRSLNEVGAYYLFMNATLLFLSFVTAFAYLTVSIEIVRIARNIHTSEFKRPTEYSKAVRAFSEFGWCFVLAKWAILFHALIILSWGHSKLGTIANVEYSIIALSGVGLFVVPIPRLYLEYKWNKEMGTRGEEYKDIRLHPQITISKFANSLFVFALLILIEDRFKIIGLAGFVEWVSKFGH